MWSNPCLDSVSEETHARKMAENLSTANLETASSWQGSLCAVYCWCYLAMAFYWHFWCSSDMESAENKKCSKVTYHKFSPTECVKIGKYTAVHRASAACKYFEHLLRHDLRKPIAHKFLAAVDHPRSNPDFMTMVFKMQAYMYMYNLAPTCTCTCNAIGYRSIHMYTMTTYKTCTVLSRSMMVHVPLKCK